MALCSSIAATVESTPPLRPQTTRPSPTCWRMRDTDSSTNDFMVQSPVQPQTLKAKLRMISRPLSVWTTSGWNRSAYRPRSGFAIAATGALALVATIEKPGGGAATKSPWLAQTRISSGTSENRTAGAPCADHPDGGVTELAMRGRRNGTAQGCAISCIP